MLVALEGIDGSGKSTLARALARRLRARGHRVLLTQEPTRTWLGRTVRRGIRERLDPLALAGLFLADRALHALEFAPALARGDVVVTDRYADSTTAYQAATLAGRLPEAFEALRVLQHWVFPRPHLVLLLDLSPKHSLRRTRGRRVREPFERERFLTRVRANYRALARRDPRRWQVLDARRPRSELVAEAIRGIESRSGRKDGRSN